MPELKRPFFALPLERRLRATSAWPAQITTRMPLDLAERLIAAGEQALSTPHHASGQHNLRKAFTPSKG